VVAAVAVETEVAFIAQTDGDLLAIARPKAIRFSALTL
jgi:hypothetical protein